MPHFSVLILTYNEEINIIDCLNTVSDSDDIVIFDSNSTDATAELARNAGSRVILRKFDNYAAQRNAALNEVDYKNDWILMLDADERLTPELRDEINRCISIENNPVTLYRMRRKDIFMGRWLRRSSGSPTWAGRLIRKGRVRAEREINEAYHTDGEVGLLKERFIHYPFNKGVAYWFERHNRYSTMEALTLSAERRNPLKLSELFTSKDPAKRRAALKRLAYRMPFRPILAFLYLYVFRMGFIDGKPGLCYATLRFCYEEMINVKMRELEHSAHENKDSKSLGGPRA